MKELQLQPRLQHLAAQIPQGSRVADIGTDHGYLPVWMIQHGIAASVIATDIAAEPLAHARRTAAEYGISNIDFRLSAGLDDISPSEVDIIIVAGMGGDTIVSILQAAPWTKQSGILLILQPMTKVEMLRGWLSDNGYCFTGESLVWDKNYIYPIMILKGGEMSCLSEAEKWSGHIKLQNDPLYKDYLTRQISRLQKAIGGLKLANDIVSHQKADELSKICRILEKKRKQL